MLCISSSMILILGAELSVLYLHATNERNQFALCFEVLHFLSAEDSTLRA